MILHQTDHVSQLANAFHPSTLVADFDEVLERQAAWLLHLAGIVLHLHLQISRPLAEQEIPQLARQAYD